MICNKDCLHCTLETCVEDNQNSLNLGQKPRDRRGYYKKYYREIKGANNAHKRAKYYYINKRQTIDAIRALKKKIGQVNTQIIIDALDKLETEIIDKEME